MMALTLSELTDTTDCALTTIDYHETAPSGRLVARLFGREYYPIPAGRDSGVIPALLLLPLQKNIQAAVPAWPARCSDPWDDRRSDGSEKEARFPVRGLGEGSRWERNHDVSDAVPEASHH